MLELTLTGEPYEIGFQHGSQAKDLVHGSISFYKEYFSRHSKMSWTASQQVAEQFLPFLEEHVPHLVQEMRGIADGASVPFASILALNARTEISMGMMNDGCTSLAWKTDNLSVAGQNWDWDVPQKARLVLAHIKPAPTDTAQRSRISTVTEAGILAKIGINSSALAVFLNAIRARGIKPAALPVHVALRLALESSSRLDAVSRLTALTAGTSAHILLADRTGATSLEFSHRDVVRLEQVGGQIAHTNHFLARHADGVIGAGTLPDSLARMARVTALLADARPRVADGASLAGEVGRMLEDEYGYPSAINRERSSMLGLETLFSIVADLDAGVAHVKLGRPSESEGEWTLRPAEL